MNWTSVFAGISPRARRPKYCWALPAAWALRESLQTLARAMLYCPLFQQISLTVESASTRSHTLTRPLLLCSICARWGVWLPRAWWYCWWFGFAPRSWERLREWFRAWGFWSSGSRCRRTGSAAPGSKSSYPAAEIGASVSVSTICWRRAGWSWPILSCSGRIGFSKTCWFAAAPVPRLWRAFCSTCRRSLWHRKTDSGKSEPWAAPWSIRVVPSCFRPIGRSLPVC